MCLFIWLFICILYHPVVVHLLSHVQVLTWTWLKSVQICKSSGVCSKSCTLSQWCHPTTSSSVTCLSCLQSFIALESFPMSWLFASGGQNIGASVSASALLMNMQGWFPLGLTALISLLSKDSQESSSAPQFESINSLSLFFLVFSFFYGPALTSVHDYWKNHSFDYADLCWQSDISAF